jgi:heme oxygenase (mycobilin-producing)
VEIETARKEATMTDGVTIRLALTLKEEIVDSFGEGLRAALKETAAFPGFRGIRVVHHKNARNQVLFIENWDSEEAYQAYIDWRTKAGALDALSQMVGAPPEFDVWPGIIAIA